MRVHGSIRGGAYNPRVEYVESILDLVGNTPMVRLRRVAGDVKPLLLAKMESLNPGGSVKDRIGLAMIEDAEKRGLLRPGGTIVEPTSGNTGHGLAMAAAIKGYKMIFVMPDKMSAEKISLLRAYGAEVVVTPTNVDKDSPQSYYSVAERLAREISGGFQPNQYANMRNPEAHHRTTGPELWRQTEGRIDVFVAGIGTGGTISGTGRFLKEQKPDVQIVGADPEGSIFSGPMHPYKVEGVGEDFWPETYDKTVVDRIVTVSDRESFAMARRLAREEGILVGGSAGMAVHAALTVAREREDEAVIAVLLPDTGRNYLSKLFNDEWMRQNGFLERLGAVRVRVALARGEGLPPLVTIAAARSVGEAIDVMHQYGISQMPVVDDDGGPVVGSLDETHLLDRVFRDPNVVTTPVSAAMDEPFPEISADAALDDAFEPLLEGSAAVTVVDGDRPVGVITRADLLEFVAHRRS